MSCNKILANMAMYVMIILFNVLGVFAKTHIACNEDGLLIALHKHWRMSKSLNKVITNL